MNESSSATNQTSQDREQRRQLILDALRCEAVLDRLANELVDLPEDKLFGQIEYKLRDLGQEFVSRVHQVGLETDKKGYPGSSCVCPNCQADARFVNYRPKTWLTIFSNIANPAIQTHPTREYLTARWVDALASGTTVASIVPKARVVDRLLWPNATVELATTNREEAYGSSRMQSDVGTVPRKQTLLKPFSLSIL